MWKSPNCSSWRARFSSPTSIGLIPPGLNERGDRPFGFLVVSGNQHVQPLSRDLPRDQRPAERGVERLDHAHPLRDKPGGLLGRRTALSRHDAVHRGEVDRVGDVDDNLPGQCGSMLFNRTGDGAIWEREDDNFSADLGARGRACTKVFCECTRVLETVVDQLQLARELAADST